LFICSVNVFEDQWEWFNIITIGGAGVAYVLLSILDIGSKKPIFDPATLGETYSSAIFKFEGSGWV
jgi:hypothetical protein